MLFFTFAAMNYPILQLRKSKDQSLQRKHPWIFSGAIYTPTDTLKDGDLVAVHDCRNQFLAIGHYQHATIAVRVLSFQEQPIDEDFFTQKLSNAVSLRLKLNHLTKQNSSFRLEYTFVKEGASIGANAICVAPITIGKWAMIGAGSVVTKDVPGYALVVGNPAKQVGWVGQSGKVLLELDNGHLKCPVTGSEFELSNRGLTKIE